MKKEKKNSNEVRKHYSKFKAQQTTTKG